MELDGAELIGTELDGIELDRAELTETALLETGAALTVEVARVELDGRPHPRLAAVAVTKTANTPIPENFIPNCFAGC